MNKKSFPFSIGFFLLIISFVFALLGLIFSFMTFTTFKYSLDRGMVTTAIVGLWFIVILVITGFFDRNQTWWIKILYIIVPFLFTFSMVRLLSPFLTAIGIQLTVPMGDVETNAIGVPQCITGVVFYIIGIILFVTASFFSVRKNSKKANSDDSKEIIIGESANE